jgi:hypothetical protein
MQCPQMMGSYLGWRLGSVYGDWLPQNLGFMQENRSLPFHPTLKISGGQQVELQEKYFCSRSLDLGVRLHHEPICTAL